MRRESTKPASSFSRRDFVKTSAVASAAAFASTLGCNSVHAQGAAELKVGLVGCGGRGRGAAVDSVNSAPGVKLWAMGDLFPDQMDSAIKGFTAKNEPAKYDFADRTFIGWDAYKKVIDSGVDIVILGTPPAFRPMMIEAAIAAGKHVFAEKPCAVCPAGVRQVTAAAKVAKEKKLGLVIGLQRRHQNSYLETIKRIQDGAIGDICFAEGYWMQGTAWMKPRQPDWDDTTWQLRNWMYFTWAAGDIIVEQHCHQHDIMNWVMGAHPKFCIGMGGRMVRTDPAYGHIYDFFAVEYEYPNGIRGLSTCRQMDGCYGRIGEYVVGTKGRAFPDGKIMINGQDEDWRFDAEKANNPYVQEHTDLINSIRAGNPLNEGEQAAESTLTAIMGRMSAYTGKLVTWSQALNSKLDLRPKPEDMKFGPRPMPAVALPGKEPLI